MAKIKQKQSIFVGILCLIFRITVCQESIPLSYTMPEESPVDDVIGNIISDASLASIYDDVTTLRFQLLTSRYSSFFNVDAASGDFYVQQVLDREQVCPLMDVCDVTVRVAILAAGFRDVSIMVRVLDLNDVTPTFPQLHVAIDVSESTPVGAEFVLAPATDLDSPHYSVQSYDVITGAAEFELVTSASEGETEVRLRLARRLDRESVAQYDVTVVARDGGTPARSGSVDVTINVVDHNDNSPVFEQDFFNVTISENFASGAMILRVAASDDDIGLNGQVRYALSAQTLQVHGSTFSVGETSGELILEEQLDYETFPVYSIIVQARDLGVGSLPASAKIILNVLDVNDQPPQMTVSGLGEGGSISVLENVGSNFPIAFIQVEDADTGEGGLVSCSIDAVRDFHLRQRTETTFTLVTARSFDFEDIQQAPVTLTCTDGGVPALSSEKGIVVEISDINDNSPEFESRGYKVRLRENNDIGATILQVAARDQDSGANGRITYILYEPGNEHLLSIDATSGRVQAEVSFDFEGGTGYTFHVAALDGGQPIRSANVTVSMDIVDMNDEAPVFELTSYNFATFENQRNGTEIGTLQASDADSTPFDDFVFTLSSSGVSADAFAINPITGEISTRRMLDREHETDYTFTVVATNTAAPHPSSSVQVKVTIIDENDNAPLISFPNHQNHTTTVTSQTAPGFIFSRVEASDADVSDNARLTYALDGGNDENLFELDPVTGALAVLSSLTDTRMTSYELSIIVSDNPRNLSARKSALTTLHVNINQSAAASLGTGSEDGGGISATHKLIIVVLAAVTGLLVLVLVTAIIVIRRRQSAAARQERNGGYKVEVAHHVTSAGGSCDVTTASDIALDFKAEEAHLSNGRSHLTLEDIKRMKCLYRNTPDVARHAAIAHKNHDVIGMFPHDDDVMLHQQLRPADDTSTDSNTDSGRGTSDAGNDSSNRIQFTSDQSRARVALPPEIHEYLSMQPNIMTSQKPNDSSTFGAHLHRSDRHAPAAMSSPGVMTSQRKPHVTFQLPHKLIDVPQPTVARTLAPPQTEPTSSHFRPIIRAQASPSAYVDMTQGSRKHRASDVTDGDNVSIASSSSGEYFVQLDPRDSRLHSVEV